MRRNGIKLTYRKIRFGVGFLFSAVLDLGLGLVTKIERIDRLECMHFIISFFLFFYFFLVFLWVIVASIYIVKDLDWIERIEDSWAGSYWI